MTLHNRELFVLCSPRPLVRLPPSVSRTCKGCANMLDASRGPATSRSPSVAPTSRPDHVLSAPLSGAPKHPTTPTNPAAP